MLTISKRCVGSLVTIGLINSGQRCINYIEAHRNFSGTRESSICR